MVCYTLLARLDLAQTYLKVMKNLLFSARPCTNLSQSYEEFAFFSKNDRKQAIFDEKSKFFVTLRQLCAESRRAKRT